MLTNDYFGHWYADGRKPYMVYSDTGGTSYVAENAATSGWTDRDWLTRGCDSSRVNCIVPTVRTAIQDHQHGMMYDDAHANWGHRDNILDPTHRAVNIGIASNGRRVVFVQHFEGGDVMATQQPALSPTGRLSFTVNKVADRVTIAEVVTVYFEDTPTPKTPQQIEQLSAYCVGGGFTEQCGDPVARILKPPPPGSYYPSLDSNELVADAWSETDKHFTFVAELGNLATTPGVYTVTIWRANSGPYITEVLAQLSVTQN